MRLLTVVSLFLICLAAPAFASAEKLVGVWKVVDAKGPESKSNKGLTYTFNKDGTMKVSYNPAKWQLSGAELSFLFGPKGNIVIKSDVEWPAKDTMIIKVRNSGGQVMTLKRQ